MKITLLLSLLLSFSCFAEEYKAPKLKEIEWKKEEKSVEKEKEWVSDYKIDENKDLKQKNEYLDQNAPDRKPSSGDHKKPKFWDFKSVK